MQTSLNSSPLIHHVVQVRARNVELRQKLTDLQNEIKNLENELDSIRTKRDELTQKSQKLRSMQSDQAKILHFEQSQRLFRQYIEEIDNYINEKQFNLPEIAEIPIQEINVETSQVSQEIDAIEKPSRANDNLNQELTAVENWLMESAVTDMDKTPSNNVEHHSVDDGADDLYTDLIFPNLSDDLSTPQDEQSPDENLHRDDFIQKSPPETSKTTRMDKQQRRLALMRQLAEKSNKMVTRKIV